ncbi:hypothetical protein ATANTOWER_024558 [Ataeniobius toweri]|uniref:Uncharacterized protein n=1 Tax=Ataeniobius toweri TaxID=208326 RepID=A0ABU7BNH7_9TELE|nr:hypothetical protein [Ataeniobius toweri]
MGSGIPVNVRATATGVCIGNRSREHGLLRLYVPSLRRDPKKLSRRWELNTSLIKSILQTFPADLYYTLGPAKSVQCRPLPVDPTHQQALIGGHLSASLHPSVQDMRCRVSGANDEHSYA